MALQRKKHLPTWRDLPLEDGIPLENSKHGITAHIYLREPLLRYLAENGRSAFVSSNSFVYYDTDDSQQYLGPDFYVVNDGVDKGQGSWVVWAEDGRFPTLALEMLSRTTKKRDRTEKRLLYQDVWQCSDYFLYTSETQRLEGLHLRDGVYVDVVAHPTSGRIPCQSLPLELGVHDGWLRWFTPDGQLLPTSEELVVHERQLRIKDKLDIARALLARGMDVDSVAAITGVPADDLPYV